MIFKEKKKNWFGVGGSWLKYLLLIPLMLLTMPFLFCLFHKIIISYIIKCMTEPPMKMTRLEAVDQMYSSINDQWLSQCTSRYEKMQWEGILSWTITRRQVSRDLWLLRPSPVIAHWVAHQQKLSSELGQNLVYWPSPTAALARSLRALWDAASRAAVLILPQIKLNSKLSSYASFLVDSHKGSPKIF